MHTSPEINGVSRDYGWDYKHQTMHDSVYLPWFNFMVEILLSLLVQLRGLLILTALMGSQLRHPQFESKGFLFGADNHLFPQ
jgi:hypothetical protein